jgi:hypothetical protein
MCQYERTPDSSPSFSSLSHEPQNTSLSPALGKLVSFLRNKIEEKDLVSSYGCRAYVPKEIVLYFRKWKRYGRWSQNMEYLISAATLYIARYFFFRKTDNELASSLLSISSFSQLLSFGITTDGST